MATYTGSGKWIKIDRGVISSGIDSHTCSSTSAATVTLNGKTYYGFVDTSTRLIIPEDQHTTSKTAKVQIEYTPLTDEAHVYYTCMAVSYDQGEAMNTVLACLQDFQKENQYYSYKYMRKDSVKYFKDDKNLKWATYHSYVKFNR